VYKRIIDNLNIRYECYNARDDYHAQLRNRVAAQATGDVDDVGEEDGEDEDYCKDDFDSVHDFDESGGEMGSWSLGRYKQMKDAEQMMHSIGWTIDGLGHMVEVDASFAPERTLPLTRWKQVLADQRKAILSS
jgi:hypothetical protein